MFAQWKFSGLFVDDLFNNCTVPSVNNARHVPGAIVRRNVKLHNMNQLYKFCLSSRWPLEKVTQYTGLLEQWVKQFIFLFAFTLVGTNAISQTAFSFAGLTWGILFKSQTTN